MIAEARKLVSNLYEIITHNKDFNYIKNFNYEFQVNSENYSQLNLNFKKSVNKVRHILNELSEAIEELEILIRQIKSVIEKENERKRKGQEIKNIRRKALNFQKYSQKLEEMKKIIGT